MKKRKIKKNKLIGILSFLLLLITGICLFLQSDFFNLNQVVITNNKYLSKKEIEKLMSINLNRNIFSYNLKEIEQNINSSSYIKSCKIKRGIPDELIVEVNEKRVIGPIYNGEEYCYVDEKGNLIDEVSEVKNKKIIINMNYKIDNKKIIFEKNDKQLLLTLINSLEKENILKQMKEININDKSNISMKTSKGLEINIKKDKKIEESVKKMQNVLVDLQNRKEYCGRIDMTYNNYILYTP